MLALGRKLVSDAKDPLDRPKEVVGGGRGSNGEEGGETSHGALRETS